MAKQLSKVLILALFLLFNQSCTTVDKTDSNTEKKSAPSKEAGRKSGLKIVKKGQTNNYTNGDLSYDPDEESDNPCYLINCNEQGQLVPDEVTTDSPKGSNLSLIGLNITQNHITPDKDVDFVQTDGPGSIQAINLIWAKDLVGLNNDLEQNIVVRDFRFYQPNSNNRLQAGNALITDGVHSGKIKQTWKSRSLSMIQENENNSTQAVNYIGSAPSGGSDINN